jgi:hypothetical protein
MFALLCIYISLDVLNYPHTPNLSACLFIHYLYKFSYSCITYINHQDASSALPYPCVNHLYARLLISLSPTKLSHVFANLYVVHVRACSTIHASSVFPYPSNTWSSCAPSTCTRVQLLVHYTSQVPRGCLSAQHEPLNAFTYL